MLKNSDLISFQEIKRDTGINERTVSRRAISLNLKIYKKALKGAGRPAKAIEKKYIGDIIGRNSSTGRKAGKDGKEWFSYNQVCEILQYDHNEVVRLARESGVKGQRKWVNGNKNGDIHFSDEQVKIMEKYDLLKKISPKGEDIESSGGKTPSSGSNNENRGKGLYHRLTEYGGLWIYS